MGIQTTGWLVQKQQGRRLDNLNANGHASSFSPRKSTNFGSSNLCIYSVSQTQLSHYTHNIVILFLVRGVSQDQLGRILKGFKHCQILMQNVMLKHVARKRGKRLFLGALTHGHTCTHRNFATTKSQYLVAINVDPVDTNLGISRGFFRNSAGQQVQQGGFTGLKRHMFSNPC